MEHTHLDPDSKRLRLSLRWSVGGWGFFLIISSALLTGSALLAHERALDERSRLRSLELLARSPVEGRAELKTREAMIRSTLKPRFSVLERGIYDPYQRALNSELGTPPQPESLRGAQGRLTQMLGVESTYELSLVISSLTGDTQVVGERSRLVIRFSSRSLWSRVSELIGDRWWLLVTQAIILLTFALYLSQEWLVSPLARIVDVARLLRVQRAESDDHDERQVSERFGELERLGPVDASRELYALRRALFELSDALRREQRTLAQAYQALQSRERLVTAGYISARVMHELGNPLSSVSGIIEFLRDEPEMTPDHRELLELAFAELGRARDTTRVIRRVTRGSDHDQSQRLSELLSITDWLRLMLRYHERSTSIELIVTGELECALSIDLDSLRYALLNLALNAAQAQGGVGALWLAVSSRERSSSGARGVQFTLLDEGPGLDPDWLEAHLARGVTRASPSELSGLSEPHQGDGGLGLLIARDAVESWGGSLWMLNADEAVVYGRAERAEERLNLARFGGARFAVWVPSADP